MGARPKSEDAKPKGKSHGEEKAAGELFASCSFTDLGLHPTLCQHLQDAMGFVSPTKVQAQAIPVVISGRHSLINAPTGTGKTIAYLAPIIHLLQMQVPPIQRSDGTFALVMVPTRELCMQVYQISQKLVHRFHWIVPGYIMGGENRSKEKSRLRKGISILVSTPGRLLDHLKNTSAFSYSKLRWIVFDEADRILELGFGKAIEEILDFLGSRKNLHSIEERKGPKARLAKRQILLLSATLNEKVNHLANISLDNPVMVGFNSKTPKLWMQNQETVSTIPERNGEKKMSDQTIDAYNLPEQLDQKYVKVSCGSRLSVLLSVLKTLFGRQVHQKIVVFFSTCDAVDFHHSLLNGFCWSPDKEHKGTFVGCKAFRLHGNMDHDDRKLSFLGFKAEKSALLLCTDVAARGLDFSKVKFIIQYDSPGEATEYVHRVGRTARLGEKGEAILFLQPIELEYIHDLQKHGVILREFSLKKILDSFSIYDQRYPKSMTSLDMHPWLLSLQKELENFISSEFEIYNLAKEAFCSWVRAYAAHRGDLKNIFMVKKLHLGHVARSFGLREQPSLVGSSFQTQMKKRKKQQKMSRPAKRTKQGSATARVMV